jgi:2-succinyl-5-enolpyruvyl-6-hydroxy-3-cyclohexene-1-carboxylate synthase
MISTKKNAQYLAAVLLEKGVTDIIFSPGSRNAPLINTFTATAGFRCLNIVDERCAAFFALGMALNLRRPVAIACTSGSAVLNYAPAVVEAYYQKAPLLVLTADRPAAWIDQGDGQTIRQEKVYANYIKGSFHLTDRIETKEDTWFAARQINEAFNLLLYPEPGPVHINIPFPEPLYDLVEEQLPTIKNIHLHEAEKRLQEEEIRKLAAVWNSSSRIMVLVGQMFPQPQLNAILGELAVDPSVAVLSETISNLAGERFNSRIDNALSAIAEEEIYRPDLLITIGGQVVSKKIKTFLRKNRPAAHWHFSLAGEHIDTFMSLTNVIPADPALFLESLKQYFSPRISDYGEKWRSLDRLTQERQAAYLDQCPYCDLKVFSLICRHLPGDSLVHLSNSTPVRYAQLFKYSVPLVFMSNRGTSGIDGVVSTAAGFASLSDKINTVITGDLAFLYDSNALWIKHLTPNLRIIVINNQGGGIFRFIDGAPSMPELETHFEARHAMEVEKVVKGYGLECFVATQEEELKDGLRWLYKPGYEKPAILEVRTSALVNADILKQYFNYLKG